MSNLDKPNITVSPTGNQAKTNSYSPAVQDYLRAMYILAEGNPPQAPVTTSQLAERLAVRPASVTSMLQKMAAADPPLVDYHKNHGASLTTGGERAALAVVRCHRLLELYLHERLGYSWDEVHDEADRLEHVVSSAMADRIAESLGHPTRDPHGHAIPTADLTLPPGGTFPLGELALGQLGMVRHISDEDPALLRQADALGLRPGVTLTLVASDPAAGELVVLVAGSTGARVVSRAVAAHVFVAGETETYPLSAAG